MSPLSHVGNVKVCRRRDLDVAAAHAVKFWLFLFTILYNVAIMLFMRYYYYFETAFLENKYH